jgi:uncharacterized membrane protein YeaQ/YmgE (transglycosylase-associated protein family)
LIPYNHGFSNVTEKNSNALKNNNFKLSQNNSSKGGMLMLWSIIIGIVAGWLAGQISRGHGFGVWVDLIVGILGAVIGNFALNLIGVHGYGLIGSLISSTVGAVLLLWIVRLFTRNTSSV